MKAYGLTHIQLTVRDLKRAESFYREFIGMQEIMRFGDECVMLRTPGSQEVFTLNADPQYHHDAGKMGGIAHFGFRLQEEMDMTDVLSRAEKAGGTAIDQGRRGKDKKETWAFLKDPDGYEIEIFWMPAE